MKQAMTVAICAALIFGSTATSTRALPGAATLYQRAVATWFDLDPSWRGSYVIAVGDRILNTHGQVVTAVLVGQGRCGPEKVDGELWILCKTAARWRHLDPEHLIVDPALQWGYMRVPSGRWVHSIDWKAAGPPYPSPTMEASPERVSVQGWLKAEADASGTLFGEKMDPGLTNHYLMEAPSFGVSPPLPMFADGTPVRVVQRFRPSDRSAPVLEIERR